MNNERNTRIETYLLGRMSAAERAQFEQELTNDNTLSTALREQEMEHDVMEAMVEMDLFQKMKTWRAEADNVVPMQQRTAAKVVPFYRRFSTLAVAASFLLLIAAVSWLFQSEINPGNQQPPLAQTELPTTPPPPNVETSTEIQVPVDEGTEQVSPPAPENETPNQPIQEETPPPAPTTSNTDYLALADDYANPLQMGTIRGNDANDDLMAKALDDLQNGRLAEGIEKLETIIASEPSNSDALFYLGLAQYQLKNYAAAITPLQKVSEDAFYLESEKAQWYLILAYLQDGQKNKAKTALQILVNDAEHSYHEPAVRLKAQL